MRLIGNIIWFIFIGLWTSIAYFIAGVILCCTIVLIPFGLQSFKLARLMMMPFGKKVDCNFTSHPIANTLWAIFVGWYTAALDALAGVFLCITVIGIPIGLQLFKVAKLMLFPFGSKIL